MLYSANVFLTRNSMREGLNYVATLYNHTPFKIVNRQAPDFLAAEEKRTGIHKTKIYTTTSTYISSENSERYSLNCHAI